MKTIPALLVLLAALMFAAPTQAQQTLRGEWRVEEVAGQAPPEGTTLTLTFGDEGHATVTYTLANDDPQAWQYTFTVEDGKLTLKPKQPFGEPNSAEYDIRFEEGKLLLLTPKPEQPEEQPEEEQEGEESEEGDADDAAGDEADPTDSDPATDTEAQTPPNEEESEGEEETEEPEEEEEEEEDTREPVWVLVPAN